MTTLSPGKYYKLAGRIGVLLLRCLNDETRQFRVLSHRDYPATEQNLTGWLVTVSAPEELEVCE